MRIVVDGVIYQMQARGGISRTFNELLPRVCRLDESLRATLVTDEVELRQAVPVHERIQHRVVPRVERCVWPWRMWRNHLPLVRRIVRVRCTSLGRGSIWHSTYFTEPEWWLGRRVVMVYDMIYERFPDLFCEESDEQFRQRKRRCVRGADLVVCNSEATSQDVQAWYGIRAERIRIVSRGCSATFRPIEKRSMSNRPTERDYILYVGTRHPYKNFANLVRAYDAWTGHREVDLVVAGGGERTSREREHVLSPGLRGRVHLLTDVTDAQLCELYCSALGLVYPSLYEGFGIPLLEAMTCGCPVIASRIPSTMEVAGDCPIYFEPDSVDDQVRALDVVLAEGRGSGRCVRGLERARRWSWDGAAQQLLNVYREAA